MNMSNYNNSLVDNKLSNHQRYAFTIWKNLSYGLVFAFGCYGSDWKVSNMATI